MRQTRLISGHPVFVSREIFHSTARLLARSLIPVYLWPTPAYRERFLLNLRGRSIYTSAQFREAASRESAALSGRPQREETRYVNVKRGRVGERRVVYGDSHDTYSDGGLSSLPLLPFLPTVPAVPSLVFVRLYLRGLIMDEAENANFDYPPAKIEKSNARGSSLSANIP